MAYMTYGSTATNPTLWARITARFATVRANLGRWRLYRQTLDELSALSNRDLADLGLSRSMIRGIAYESAYGE